ncbi:hypothetical protein [Lentibacillus salicampi]|uniref:Transcriptional regulator n=1 Tax=Lentibacillus salicampi TaxID=175306 RepID=A0A4Y9A8S9_9BACI|nr:hypothetical protein [Lentibacillus salicampi]TFJ91270.1 hypothetical protein E4U82_18555 [Lentibacillus salicampi]
MKVKVAVFCPMEIRDRLDGLAESLKDVELLPFVYSDTGEIRELVEKAFMCDIYLFADALSYLHAKETIDKKRLPAVQVDFDAYMLLSSFYHIRHVQNQELTRLSIDIPDDSHVDEVLQEIDISRESIHTYSYGHEHGTDTRQIAEHHTELWKAGKIDYVLTSIRDVHQTLQEKNIPVSCMDIPKLNLMQAIEKATSIASINQSTSAQIVAGYVSIKDFAAIQSEKGVVYTQEMQATLQQILFDYFRKTYASILPNSHDQFVLFGTRGTLNHITSHYRDFPLLKEMESTLAVPVDIGFGLGLTARQAEDNAKLALQACDKRDEGSCYIVNERSDMIGPLGVKKAFNPSMLYRSLIHEAKLNNELSYNFINFIEVRNNEPFSSNDIANYYGVTKRSAERTIKKLAAGNVIKTAGEEKPYVKGRPRKLFQLNQ